SAGMPTGGTGETKAPHAKTRLAMTLNYTSIAFDYLDPALAYLNISLQFRYLTDCRLLYYPDKPAPEGATLKPDWSNMPVISKGGSAYTFTMRPNAGGCKFNPGEAVTAQRFADAINRDPNPQMQSPAVQFI